MARSSLMKCKGDFVHLPAAPPDFVDFSPGGGVDAFPASSLEQQAISQMGLQVGATLVAFQVMIAAGWLPDTMPEGEAYTNSGSCHLLRVFPGSRTVGC